jgi:hypothetical protein
MPHVIYKPHCHNGVHNGAFILQRDVSTGVTLKFSVTLTISLPGGQILPTITEVASKFSLRLRPCCITVMGVAHTVHRCAFYQIPLRWIYYYGSNKTIGKETGKTHLCAVGQSSSTFQPIK